MSQSDVKSSLREEFYENFLARLESRFPLDKRFKNIQIEKRLISNLILELPKEILEKIQNFASALFQLRTNKVFQSEVLKNAPSSAQFDPGNFSVLMGYDFHLTENGDPKLLEINTNAAFSLPLHLIYECHHENSNSTLSGCSQWDLLKTLKLAFLEELSLNHMKERNTIAIVDQTPWSQPFAREFLMFQKLFEEWGFKAMIGSPEEFVFRENRLWYQNSQPVDMIYNRMTDFLLQEPQSQSIASAYLSGAICLSPNPHEYYLLAMKNRLIQLCQPDFLSQTGLSSEAIKTLTSMVPRTTDINANCDQEGLWQSRKKLFFKPKNSFGSRGTYRGSGLTTKVFQELFQSENYIAQEYVPAPTLSLPELEQPLKYDLRFYVYKDQIQLAGARLYLGQVTNFQSGSGGFAAIHYL